MKGQILADFIVQHRVYEEQDVSDQVGSDSLGSDQVYSDSLSSDQVGSDINLVSLVPWRLYFDGSVCSNGQGLDIVYISTTGTIFEASRRLEYNCTNNQAEYEALLFGLEFLVSAGVTHIEAYGDSLLIVQQISKVFQCLDGSLNVYLNRCLDVISTLDYFTLAHVSRHDNWLANELAQQASGYHVSRSIFLILEKPMLACADFRGAKVHVANLLRESAGQ